MIRSSHGNSILIAASLLALCMAAPGWAQMNPFATGGAEAPLLEASPSGGLNSATYIGRAQGVAGGAGAAMGMQPGAPGVQPGAQPGGWGAGGAMPDEAMMEMYATMGAMPGYGGYGVPMGPTPTPTPPPVRVLTGERVYSHLQWGTSAPELLSDAEVKTVPRILSQLTRQYYDDGTHGDVKPGDDVWSYVVERNDVMSANEFRVLRRLLSALITISDQSPKDFFRIPVATSEMLASLPKTIDLEQQRDEVRLENWNREYLGPFRVNPEDPESPFWPLFVPPPPPMPEIDPPPGYDPSGRTVGAPGQQAGFGGGAAAAAGMDPALMAEQGYVTSGAAPTSQYMGK